MASLHKLVIAIAVVLACLGVSAEARGQTVSPGQVVGREIGPLTIDCAVDGTHAAVVVTLALDGKLVGQRALTPDNRDFRFDVAAGASSASGTLSLDLETAPQLSSVEADIATRRDRGPPVPFRGAVATWLAPDDLVYVERTFDLTPDLSARTIVRGSSKANVSVTLFAGSTLIYSVSMTQAAPVAVITDELVLGDVRIAPGMKFMTTIPTPRQLGQVVAEGQFESRNIPKTSISAAIATWPW